jgi:hypothetical protein
MSAGDPIGSGIVAGLARPGGNITGMSVQMAEQEGKRLELLKKLLPSFSRVAVLSNPSNPYCAIAVGEARRGATFVRDTHPLARQKRIGHDEHGIGTYAAQRQECSVEAARIRCLHEVELRQSSSRRNSI